MSESTEDVRKNLVALAIDIAQGYKFDFDFSEKSLKHVDRILEDVHRDLRKTPEDAEKVSAAMGIALEMGAYIVEVADRHHGKGSWKRDDPKYGEDTWPYIHGEMTVFPVGWCLKRIQEGKAHSVWDKYEHAFLLSRTRSS